ncbi:MAG: hypothetical protein SVM80_08685 [Halobacteriota archaeon]|nr:hypothetical protein [Halobacteriota archaeon]
MFTGMLNSAKMPEPNEQLITKMISQAPRYPFIGRPEFGGILGDLFFTDKLVYLLAPIETEMLQAAFIGHEELEEALRNFCADVEKGITTRFDGRRVRGMEFDWKIQGLCSSRSYRRRYPTFVEEFFEEEPERAELKGTEPKYSLEDVKATEFLVDTDVRTVYAEISSSR